MSEGRLPLGFADLQPLADLFSIGDDLARSAREEEADRELQCELVDKVEPRLAAINAYLDTHDDDSAHLLGRLAEAACEVALTVGWSEARRG
jgi:hypothetical protein